MLFFIRNEGQEIEFFMIYTLDIGGTTYARVH